MSAQFTGNIGRVGANYHLDIGGPAPALAKY